MDEKITVKNLKKLTGRAYWLGIGLGLIIGLLAGLAIGYQLGSPQTIIVPLSKGIKT
ncbi:MAG: hypothetical protein AB8B81_06500 [Halioglobus sp.]